LCRHAEADRNALSLKKFLCVRMQSADEYAVQLLTPDDAIFDCQAMVKK